MFQTGYMHIPWINTCSKSVIKNNCEECCSGIFIAEFSKIFVHNEGKFLECLQSQKIKHQNTALALFVHHWGVVDDNFEQVQ